MAYEGYNLLSVSSENQLMFPEDIPFFRRPKDLAATGCYGKFPFVENFYAFKGEKLGFFSYSCDT